MPDQLFALTSDQVSKIAAMLKDFERVRQKVDGLNGHGVNNSSRSITIAKPANRPDVSMPPIPQRLEVSSISAIGVYGVKTIATKITVPDDGDDLTEDDLGTVAASENAILWNLSDINSGTNELAVGDVVEGVYLTSDSDGTNIFKRDAGGGALPTPQYQGQVDMAVAQNTLGASFVFAHAPVGE